MKKAYRLDSIINCAAEVLVESACRYLKKNISEKHTLDGVAVMMGTNRSKLAASFKSVLGLSVFEYLRKIRMETARTLLITSDIPVQQISFEVGYEDSANFSTAFKRYYQLSPRDQRGVYANLKSVASVRPGAVSNKGYYKVECSL